MAGNPAYYLVIASKRSALKLPSTRVRRVSRSSEPREMIKVILTKEEISFEDELTRKALPVLSRSPRYRGCWRCTKRMRAYATSTDAKIASNRFAL